MDWAVGEKDLTRPQDALNDADWDAVYQQECADEDEMLELEGSVYNWLRATPPSMPASTDTEAATGMNALSMDLPKTPASSLPDS